jgi:hypothetical protein
MIPMWILAEPTDVYRRRHKRYEKKKRNQLLAVLDNLDTLMKGLNQGLKLEQVMTFGFVHSEPHGVLAVDQTGGKKLAETRLYIFPDKETLTVYPITLGDKGSQQEDIETCALFTKQMRTQRGGVHEPEKTLP